MPVDLTIRFKVINPVSFSCTFLFISQIVYILVNTFDLTPFLYSVYGHYAAYEGVYMYAAIFLAVYLSSIGLRIQGKIDYIKLLQPFLRHEAKAFIFCLLVAVIGVLSINWSVLWFSADRFGSVAPENATFAYSPIFTNLARLTGIACGMFSGIAIYRVLVLPTKKWLFLYGWLALTLLATANEVAVASRLSSVPVLVVAIVLWLIAPRKNRPAIILFAAPIAYVLLSSALVGRDEQYFGYSQIPGLLFQGGFSLPIPILLNFFEGIFTTSEAMAIPVAYNETYKLLSFSPFPSSIDSFNENYLYLQVRLHDYAPFSAYGEAYHFGYGYLTLLLVTIALAMRNTLHLAKINAMAFLFCTVMMLFNIILSVTYNVRNCYRAFLLSLVIALVVRAWPKFVTRRRVELVT